MYICIMSKGINNHATYSVNPFRIEQKHIVRVPVPIGDNVSTVRESDFQEHIRIFPEMFDDLEQLSSMAIKILVYFFSELKKDKDEVYFDLDCFFRFTNRPKLGEDTPTDIKNKAGVYRGLGDLLDRNLIARKAGDAKMFYINPSKFFAGSRAKWFPIMKDIPHNFRTILIDKRLNGEKGVW